MAVTHAGQLPQPPKEWSAQYQAELNRSIEWIIVGNSRSGLRNVAGDNPRYVVRNFTKTFILDMATATQADINNFVLTVIADIIQRGQVS